jgi:hypothetical protein
MSLFDNYEQSVGVGDTWVPQWLSLIVLYHESVCDVREFDEFVFDN